MQNRMTISAAVLCLTMLLSACGGSKEDTAHVSEPAVTPIEAEQDTPADSEQENEEITTADDTSAPADSEQESEEIPSADDTSVPAEFETADGFMSSFLLASDRDKIDTTNDYGVLYRVVYEASLEGDELIACGSMDYRNTREQDSITISSDLKHVFKVDDSTVYQKGGEESIETISKEEFAELLGSRKDSGMFLGIEIKNGVVTTAELSAQ